jgi:hypothetical protein
VPVPCLLTEPAPHATRTKLDLLGGERRRGLLEASEGRLAFEERHVDARDLVAAEGEIDSQG